MWALVGIGERPAPRYSARALTAFIPRGLILSPATEQRRTHSSEGKFHRIKSSGKTYRFVSTHPPAQQGQDALGSVHQPWPLTFFTAGEILHRSSPGPRLLSQLVPVNFRRKARSVASVGPVPTDRPSSTARQTVGLGAVGRGLQGESIVPSACVPSHATHCTVAALLLCSFCLTLHRTQTREVRTLHL